MLQSKTMYENSKTALRRRRRRRRRRRSLVGPCEKWCTPPHPVFYHDYVPVKILSPLLSTAPLQYVPKIRFTQATIDCLINNKTKNALHNKSVILNYIGGDPLSHSLSN